MEYRNHGGRCCGYGHIFDFDHATEVDLDNCLQEHDFAAGGNNRVCEVILSRRQVDPTHYTGAVSVSVRNAGGWPAILARKGFRLAAVWNNSNTGRHCYQFIKIGRLLTDDPVYELPFDWQGLVAAAQGNGVVAPVAPRRVDTVSTEFYAQLRVGGRRGPFATEREAREAYPRCRRFQQRNIMSNGTSTWLDLQPL
jgi:hypothetical protein